MLYNWYQHISFAYPWVLPLLLVVPYLLYWYFKSNQQQTATISITTTFFLNHTQNWKTRLRHLPFFLRCLALICLIIALARPQQKFTEEQTNGEGIDIVLCFDISGSMTEQDFTPNRLEAAKEVAANFVQNRPGDRIGVVIFSSQSFTLCPITPDHKTVLIQISNIHNGYLPEDGTAIGSGLATSVDRLRASTAKSKVVILLTDGVDFGGVIPPDIAKKLAKTYGVKVYCIGIGTEQEMDVKINSILGAVTQKRKMSFNENLLKDISAETGGQYFQAANKEALTNIYASINQLEKSKVETTTYNRSTDEFLPFLLIGLGLIVLELVLRLSVWKKFP
ncbi:MAG: VWA domain-containing protein [Pedobacter sp.]|nr:VWA domain-containing protein [Chitinophagaceae bacterium]